MEIINKMTFSLKSNHIRSEFMAINNKLKNELSTFSNQLRNDVHIYKFLKCFFPINMTFDRQLWFKPLAHLRLGLEQSLA